MMRKLGSQVSRRKKRVSLNFTPKPLILITCEGETEEEYFNEIRRKLRLPKERVRILSKKQCSGNDPLTLVRCAKTLNIQQRKDIGIGYDHVWCVFDCDEHRTIPAAIDMARRHDFRIAFSNPCFELWFLIHFRRQTAFINREQLVRTLKNEVGFSNYEKGLSGLFSYLENRLDTAIANARTQRKHHHESNRDITANPSTNVDEIIELLLKNI
ncbi:MAG: RloB family protein [Pseudomonadota bacterium]